MFLGGTPGGGGGGRGRGGTAEKPEVEVGSVARHSFERLHLGRVCNIGASAIRKGGCGG